MKSKRKVRKVRMTPSAQLLALVGTSYYTGLYDTTAFNVKLFKSCDRKSCKGLF